MAEGATYAVEQRATGCDGCRAAGSRRGRRRRSQEAHEVRKRRDIAAHFLRLSQIKVGVVFWSRVEQTAGRFIPLRLKDLIGDTHLDVVRFARKQLQRFVLGLPAESRDRSVVAVSIWVA